MPKLTMLNVMRKRLLPGLFAAALVALIGLQAGTAVEAAPGLWSVIVHFEYDNGFEYDYVLARNVSTTDLPAMLEACGRSHNTGSVVRYHCYPIPE